MQYFNIKTQEFEEIEITNPHDLVQFNDCLKDSIKSIVDEIKAKIEKGEELPASAYNVVFENFDYEHDSLNIIEFIKNLMTMEECNSLPKFTAFVENSEILIENMQKQWIISSIQI